MECSRNAGIFEDCPQTQEINIHGTWGYWTRGVHEKGRWKDGGKLMSRF
jgi:hypothetical protein